MILQRHSYARGSALMAVFTIVFVGLTGCSPAQQGVTYQAPSPTAIALPESKSGELTSWVISQMNSDASVDAAAVQARMDAELLKGITANELAKIFDERRRSREWVPTRVKVTSEDEMEITYVRLQSTTTSAVTVLEVAQSSKSELMAGIYFLAPGAVDFPLNK